MKTKKNTIKLTESELKRVISESVNNILKEYAEGNEMYAIPGEGYDPSPERITREILEECNYFIDDYGKIYECAAKTGSKELKKYIYNYNRFVEFIIRKVEHLQLLLNE